MSKPPSSFPSSVPTPAPSSPPPSESFFSELDGTASVVETSAIYLGWDDAKVDPSSLNLVSWKLGVNAKAEDGVNKRGFNAISTVLNHPTKKANPLRGSRKPLPPLKDPPLVLPKPPPPSHYDTYLQVVTPLYDNFVNAQASASNSSSSTLLRRDSEYPLPDRSNLPALDSVSDIYFSTSFDLANPSTWAEVVDQGEASTSQERLSTHLDFLERHLVHEITLRSTSFFSALSNLQDLHSESASCLARIADLQESLQEVGVQQAQKGLEIIDAQEELRQLRLAEQGIRDVGELEDKLEMARQLVEGGDWSGGLSCAGDIVRWWERHRPSTVVEDDSERDRPDNTDSAPLALSTIPALAGLPTSFQESTAQISTQLRTALHSSLLTELTRADEGVLMEEGTFGQSIRALLEGMARCGAGDQLEATWREVVTISVREGSRKHLPSTTIDSEPGDEIRGVSERGASLADSLKAMDHARFLLLTVEMNATMLSRLHRVQGVGQILQRLASSMTEIHPLSLSADAPADKPTSAPELDLSDILASACELANTRASKILAVRAEQHAALALDEFVELYQANWEFVQATETLAKRMIVPLRGTAASQARVFLVAYHSLRLTKSAKLVEEEQWSQVEVSPAVQHTVNLLVQSAMADPAECSIPPPPAVTNGESKTAEKTLSIEDRTYFVVRATAESLELLADYLKIVINLELVVTDVMSRIIEFLKSFNSRTCQVVLGAGAMRSAGLKNITAKHLALASQSLSVVVALIPYIREFIRRHLSPKQAVMLTEFDKLKRDYQEHQNEIHAKLVAIMSDRLAVHCGSLREIDWESTPEKDTPRPYAELLVKETATLHKVLSKYLSSQTVESVMSEVIRAIVSRLSEEYKKPELKSDEAKKRMLQDVALINIRLGPLSEAGKELAALEALVKDKPIPRKMLGLLRRGGSTGVKDDSKAEKGEERHEVEAPAELEGDEEEESQGGPDPAPSMLEQPIAEPEEESSLSEEKNDQVHPTAAISETPRVESEAVLAASPEHEEPLASEDKPPDTPLKEPPPPPPPESDTPLRKSSLQQRLLSPFQTPRPAGESTAPSPLKPASPALPPTSRLPTPLPVPLPENDTPMSEATPASDAGMPPTPATPATLAMEAVVMLDHATPASEAAVEDDDAAEGENRSEEVPRVVLAVETPAPAASQLSLPDIPETV